MAHMDELHVVGDQLAEDRERMAAVDREQVFHLLFLENLPDQRAAIDFTHR